MSGTSDTFFVYAALFLGAALLLAPTMGIGVIIAAGVAVYLMLAATNAIERGERKANKQLRDAQEK
jgi:hypothetical protein